LKSYGRDISFIEPPSPVQQADHTESDGPPPKPDPPQDAAATPAPAKKAQPAAEAKD